MRTLLYIALIGLFASCGSGRRMNEPVAANYFSGDFAYFADAANFFDCATGERFPVSNQGEFILAQQKYMEMNPEMGERIFITFKGHIEYLPSMEESQGKIRTIIIDSLMSLSRSEKCEENYSPVGVYQSEGEGIKSVLRMRGDYTFTEIEYDKDGAETTWEGTWGMASKLQLVLEYNDGEEMQEVFEYIPGRESLVRAVEKRNKADKTLIYKKVYL